LGRLKDAAYGEGSNIGSNTQRYSEAFTYDKQGNPLTLQRYGLKDNNTYGLIDNLRMNAYNGNFLREVQDLAGDQSASDVMEFKDGITNPGEEYVYGFNGVLTSDYNKKICMIKYNYLTLPKSVQFRSGNRVEYVYDAAGLKHRTKHKVTNRDMAYPAWSQSEPAESDFIAAQTVTTDYISNKIYKNGQLSMLLTEEGYIEKSGSTYTHHYYLKDHLGNHRVVMNASGTVVQATNYYPSGTTIAERQTDQGIQPYKFGGKELDRKDNLNFYDYEARAYDPTLMRFTSTDPMMEKYYGWSPFAYCLNNPVKFIDPDGKEPRIYVETKGFGHAFVTVGTGDKTIVYTYGRYGELGKDKSSARGTTPTGEGVLIKLTGDEAKTFIQDQITNKEAVAFEFTKGSDEVVAKHFDDKLNSSDKTPTKGDYAGKENAKVVDKYNVLTNNCVTTSVEGVQSGSKQDLKLGGLKGTMAIKDVLNVQSGKKESNVIKIPTEEIKKELKLPNE
jgi:RHS repeat-associated protein